MQGSTENGLELVGFGKTGKDSELPTYPG